MHGTKNRTRAANLTGSAKNQVPVSSEKTPKTGLNRE